MRLPSIYAVLTVIPWLGKLHCCSRFVSIIAAKQRKNRNIWRGHPGATIQVGGPGPFGTTICCSSIREGTHTINHLTVLEEILRLQTDTHLRVKPGSDLDTHGRWEQDEVQVTKVRFLVPWYLVFLGETLDNGIGGTRLARLEVDIVAEVAIHNGQSWQSTCCE